MRRRNLAFAKKGIAVVIASSIVLSQGIMAFAEDVIIGVVADASEKDVEKNVDDNVTVTDNEGSAEGIFASSYDGYEAKVTVSGDVTVTEKEKSSEADENKDSDYDNYSSAVGISAQSGDSKSYYGSDSEESSSKSKTTVTVGGDVKVTNESSAGNASGISARAGEDSEVSVTTGDVSVSGSYVTGVSASTYGDGNKISISTGGVTASGTVSASGISASDHSYGYSDNEELAPSSIDIEVNGDIKTEGMYATGYSAYSSNANSEINANIKGGIYVDVLDQKTDKDSEDSYYSSSSSAGISINSPGKATVTVSGGITSDDKGIMIGDGTSYSSSEKNDAETKNPEISVTVGGDVTASGTAVEVRKGELNSDISIEVDGTIKGEHNLVIDRVYEYNWNEETGTKERTEKTSETIQDGLSVTVWKIDTSQTNGRTAEIRTSGDEIYSDEGEYLGVEPDTFEDASDKAASFINYIIKVDKVSTAGGNLTAGSDKAREGETVNLEVTVPAGYSIDSFYTGEGGTNVEVKKDESTGKYYIVVPRGGGVFVGVTMKRNYINSSDDSSDSGSDSSSNNNKQAGGFVDNTGKSVDLAGRVTAPQSIMVNGQQIDAKVTVTSAGEVMEKAFADALRTVAGIGMFDARGSFIQVSLDAVVKESFSFTAEGIDGFVTTYLDIANYKAGDVIMCSYIDALGNPVLVAITPDMINGTALLVTIPANCTLAIAGTTV